MLYLSFFILLLIICLGLALCNEVSKVRMKDGVPDENDLLCLSGISYETDKTICHDPYDGGNRFLKYCLKNGNIPEFNTKNTKNVVCSK